MQIAEVMTNLCAHLGLPTLQPDDEGDYAIQVDTLTINFCGLSQDDDFLVISRLASIGLENQDAVETLLERNLPGQDKAGGVLALDPEGAAVMIRRCDARTYTFPDFIDTLESFVGQSRLCQAALQTGVTSPMVAS